MHSDKQPPQLPDNIKNMHEQLVLLIEEYQKLLQENQQLKRNLQSEQALRNILYKEFQDLKNRQLPESKPNRRFSFINQRSEINFKHFAFIVLSLFVLVMGFMIFNQKNNSKVLSSVTLENSTSTKEQSVEQISSSNTKEVKNIKPKSTISLGTAAINERHRHTSNFLKSNDIAHLKEASVNGAIDNSNTLLYKVKTKAYFHNNADNNTRRKAFIVHWNNTYATLKPLDEKNGFIYVVFTNHLGQTSKGWLNKNDLYSVNQK
jgi:DNA gyrase/topoisomerase IV subunit A